VKIISFLKKILKSFFNFLKEPLLAQKQTIPQQKALTLSFLELESLRAWHYQESSTPTYRKKTLKKKVNLAELSQDSKKKNQWRQFCSYILS
jgi:dTDP-4-dehydrorhamnose 3,5-epimerase-like enzyme